MSDVPFRARRNVYQSPTCIPSGTAAKLLASQVFDQRVRRSMVSLPVR